VIPVSQEQTPKPTLISPSVDKDLLRKLKTMLCAIRQRDRQKVGAWDQQKTDGPFSCPLCIEETILKKGIMKVHHFAHKPPITCEYGSGETERHRECKLAICEGLRRQRRFREVEIERRLGTVRPDVSGFMGEIPFAIEVQISALTMDQIVYRTSEYAKQGIYVLWLALHQAALEEKRYSPRAWERWVHAAYFGRVYYWVQGLEAIPYHLGECIEFVESCGYRKLFKRFRVPKKGRTVSLADSFLPRHRAVEWRSRRIVVPESRLLIDTQPIWW
jgi:competence protein CoiA